MPKVRALIVVLLLHVGSGAQAQDNEVAPNFITCVKVIDTLDFYSRDILQPACLTVMERYCTAPIRRGSTCLDDFLTSMNSFIEIALPLLPPPPPELSGFRKNSYERMLEMATERASSPPDKSCALDLQTCEIVHKAGILFDIFHLAHTANVTLP